MSNSENSGEEDEWVQWEPPGLKLRYIFSWMFGRRKRGMVANPWGFRETASPPYHFLPVPSPHLVPRPLRPFWVVFYYIPLWLKHRYVDEDQQKAELRTDGGTQDSGREQREYVDIQQLLDPDEMVEGHPVEVNRVGWATIYSCLKCPLEQVPHVELSNNPCQPRPLHTERDR